MDRIKHCSIICWSTDKLSMMCFMITRGVGGKTLTQSLPNQSLTCFAFHLHGVLHKDDGDHTSESTGLIYILNTTSEYPATNLHILSTL